MIASRSYMCIEPIELYLDPQALRRGLVLPVTPDEPFALLVQDSGMVPVSTQIAIVNPETNALCHVGEYGEIWVSSEASGHSFYMSKDPLDVERFNGQTVDGDPSVIYIRTGDLGFLHSVSRPIGPGGANVEMQILFVLGSIGETFDVNGLSHFPVDIENSIERCHRNIVPGGSAVFQAGGLVVVLAEVHRKNFLASIVPVIVNAVLNAHQVVVDIVAFVGKGDFPRSRLGEKQRGKILASWVTRRLRTIAQFGIKDFDAPTEVVRNSGQSFRNGGSVRGSSSLREVGSLSQLDASQQQDQRTPGYIALPEGLAEMPAGDFGFPDDSSILESPPMGIGNGGGSDSTPTGNEHGNGGVASHRPHLGLDTDQYPQQGNGPVELPTNTSDFELGGGLANPYDTPQRPPIGNVSELPAMRTPVDAVVPSSPSVYSPMGGTDSQITYAHAGYSHSGYTDHAGASQGYQLDLPAAVDGRGSVFGDHNAGIASQAGQSNFIANHNTITHHNLNTNTSNTSEVNKIDRFKPLPNARYIENDDDDDDDDDDDEPQVDYSSYSRRRQGGGLRIANRTSTYENEGGDWEAGHSRRPSGGGSRGRS
jgi:hypothetical protein